MKTNNEIRLAAANLLESRDNAWCQEDFRRPNTDGTYAYCMIGACREVAGYYAAAANAAAFVTWAANAADAACAATANAAYADAAASDAAYAAFVTWAADAAAVAASDAATFNDTKGRTKQEIIAALRAIKETNE